MLSDFKLSEIQITDEYALNAFNKNINYLLELDEYRFLANFYKNAGIETPYEKYGGWENSLIAGHSLGHYMTAISQVYENAVTPAEVKERITRKIENILSALRECQLNSKSKKGFIWGANQIDDKNVEIQFDNVEKNKTNIIKQAWVPWYTMHKLICGLTSVYNATGFEDAKIILTELCDWVYDRASKWTDKQKKTVLSIEYGGMNDCLYSAFKITGKREHLFAAHIFDEEELFNKVLSGKKNALNNLHSNTTIPKFMGALTGYKVMKENEELFPNADIYLEYAKAFFDTVVKKHSYITGDLSEWEHFGKDNILDSERTQYNCETCAAYNMLIMARELFKITGDKKYADYYENTFINSIMSAQNPETGMAMYFQPMAAGFFKVYSSPFDSFWCCTGTGMEDFTKIGDSVYFKGEDSLYVNYFLSSSLNYADKNCSVETVEDLINSGAVKIKITSENGSKFALKIRIPDWSEKEFGFNSFGFEGDYGVDNGYLIFDGKFSSRCEIELKFNLKVRAFGLKDERSVRAFKYGPYVLCAKLGKEKMDIGTTGVSVFVPKRAILAKKTVICDGFTKEELFKEPNKYFIKKDGMAEFVLNADREYTFVPYYSEYKHRYAIYWYFKNADEDMLEENGGVREILDTVQPGYGQYENDALHDMQEQNTVGCTSDGTYRYAKKGGKFTYRLKVEEGRRNQLICYFKKKDNNRSLIISVNGKTVFDGTLNYGGKQDIYERVFDVADDIILNESEDIEAIGESCKIIPVTFSGKNEESAKVCEFIYINLI